MPTIRIDAAVWEWLKNQARPLEDTPNSILRRIAGFDGVRPARVSETELLYPDSRGDPARRSSKTRRATANRDRVTGSALNAQFRLGLRHALYHRDGTFYERLSQFPGGLCDARGYLRFDSEKQFLGDPRLAIGEKVNVRGGVASHPRYAFFKGAR